MCSVNSIENSTGWWHFCWMASYPHAKLIIWLQKSSNMVHNMLFHAFIFILEMDSLCSPYSSIVWGGGDPEHWTLVNVSLFLCVFHWGNFNWFRMTWWWVNDGFYFGWTITLWTYRNNLVWGVVSYRNSLLLIYTWTICLKLSFSF